MDPDSPLYEDMKKLKSAEGRDHLLFHLVFDDKFPYTPPFVRLVRPVVNGGYVLAGGAICMELLTPQVSVSQCWGGRNSLPVLEGVSKPLPLLGG